jgi:hypothetical protein
VLTRIIEDAVRERSGPARAERLPVPQQDPERLIEEAWNYDRPCNDFKNNPVSRRERAKVGGLDTSSIGRKK